MGDADVDQLRIELAEVRAELAALRGGPPPAGRTTEPTRSSRRDLLRLAATGLAGAGATTLLASQPAAAANGNALVLGTSNASTSDTTLTGTSTTTLDVENTSRDALRARTTGAGATALTAVYDGGGYYGTAIDAECTSPSGVGVEVFTNATSCTGILVFAEGDTSSGLVVRALGGNAVGAEVQSSNAQDLYLSGGRLLQKPATSAGPPPTLSGAKATPYAVGEQARDRNGELYLCVAAGNPGVWKRAAAVAAGYAGGATHFLSSPVRLLDTRAGQSAHLVTGRRLGKDQSVTVPVGGFTYGGVTLPDGVAGVVVNVTAVSPTAAGYLVAYPGGGSRPNVSTVSFGSGQTIANGATVGAALVGGHSAITVTASSVSAAGTVDVLVDIAGFVV